MTDTNDETDVESDADESTGRLCATPSIEPAVPPAFGLVQVWWGDGKGKTTSTIGMGLRAAGHGYRVHVVQFLKGGASTVEDVRGEYNAIEHVPGFTVEHAGHYGWHGFADGSEEDDHVAQASAGLERVRELLGASEDAERSEPIPLDAPPGAGVHMLILDEVLYAVSRDLISEANVVDLIESKPADLELVLTGGHQEPRYLLDHADLVTEVVKRKHPIETGQGARKGTEY